MAEKVTIDIEKGIITEGADTGLGKILAAASKVKMFGRELKIKKDKKSK